MKYHNEISMEKHDNLFNFSDKKGQLFSNLRKLSNNCSPIFLKKLP